MLSLFVPPTGLLLSHDGEDHGEPSDFQTDDRESLFHILFGEGVC